MTDTTLDIVGLTSAQADTYVERGFTLPEQSHEEWAAEFRRLGGVQCHVRPNMVVPKSLIVDSEGTMEAIAFVRRTVASLGPSATRS